MRAPQTAQLPSVGKATSLGDRLDGKLTIYQHGTRLFES